MVSTTRPISCLTLFSRSGVPIWPRKYLETTMLVACCDQKRGISTSRCSKTSSPFSLPITADRISHSTSSNGSMPSRLKNRSNSRPGAPTGAVPGVLAIACGVVVSSDPAELVACAATVFCILPPPSADHPRPHGVIPNEQVISGAALSGAGFVVSDPFRRCPGPATAGAGRLAGPNDAGRNVIATLRSCQDSILQDVGASN